MKVFTIKNYFLIHGMYEYIFFFTLKNKTSEKPSIRRIVFT